MKSLAILILMVAFALPAKSEESYFEKAEFDYDFKFERRKRDGVYKCKSGLYVTKEDLSSEKAMQKGDLKLYITKLTKETKDWETKAEGIIARITNDPSIGDPYLFKDYSAHIPGEAHRKSVFGFSLPISSNGMVNTKFANMRFFLYERNRKKLILGINYNSDVLIDSDGTVHDLSTHPKHYARSKSWDHTVCDYPRKGLISGVSVLHQSFSESEKFPVIILYSRYTHEGYTDQESTFSF